mgnify:CR=1 FL=1
MKIPLLEIKDLQVAIETKTVIDNFNLEIEAGKVLVLMGPNGSGKSSLAMTLMGDSRYKITNDLASVEFRGKDLLTFSPDQRAREGVYVAWQNPVSIPGVSVFSLCKASYEACGNKLGELVGFKKRLEKLTEKVDLPKEYIGRNVNEGFSGGEKKRLELLQLLLLQPKLAILDEIDSGLDVDGLKKVADIVNEMKAGGTTFILITHYKKLLDYVDVDQICVMKASKVIRMGGRELASEIEEKGYGKLPTRV